LARIDRFPYNDALNQEGAARMRVGVVGINHKLADLKLREQLAKSCQRWFGALQAVHGDHYFVLLCTCNRTEIYFSSHDLATTHSYLLGILRVEVKEEFDHKLYSYFGADCFCHLTRVTLGLDSAIIAETEIQGQVKLAYENTVEYHALPGDLHFLFQKALGIAKKLRSELQLGRGMPNLEHAILQTGKQIFQIPEQARLLFVGASDINQKILMFLKNKNFQNVTLCNRSEDQAKALAEQYHVNYLAWSELKCWHEYDWIIFGTKSPDYLITQQEISQRTISQKLIMDLCVPRNVDPKLGQDTRITLLNIDQINRLLKIRHRRMTNTLEEAEKRVVHATHEHATRYVAKSQSKIALLAVTA
jgi:glutamyl-tRNA reductase